MREVCPGQKPVIVASGLTAGISLLLAARHPELLSRLILMPLNRIVHTVRRITADNLNALFWGLHDWAHFHNHGPLDEPAWTELQCDTAALAWIVANRAEIGLDEGRLARLHAELVALSARRFAGEGKPFDPAWMDLARVRRFVDAERAS